MFFIFKLRTKLHEHFRRWVDEQTRLSIFGINKTNGVAHIKKSVTVSSMSETDRRKSAFSRHVSFQMPAVAFRGPSKHARAPASVESSGAGSDGDRSRSTVLRLSYTRFVLSSAAADGRSDRQPQPRRARAEPFVAASAGRTSAIASTVAATDVAGQRVVIRE